jgi:hypothetical protein
VFYFGQRQWIFDVPIEDDLEDLIQMTIEHFMAGARVVMPSLLGVTAVSKSRSRTSTKGKH